MQEGDEVAERGRRPIGWGRIALLSPVYLTAMVLIALLVRVGGVEAFESEGPSMEPALLDGDRFVVDKTAYGLFLPFTSEALLTWATPERGDVIVLRSPHDGISIIKRVVAVPGDTVEIRDDTIVLNGEVQTQADVGRCAQLEPALEYATCNCFEEQIGDRHYISSRDLSSPPSRHSAVVIPPGHVYVLGDHRDRSNDSRFFGPVPIANVRGRAMFIYYSDDARDGVRTDRILQEVP